MQRFLIIRSYTLFIFRISHVVFPYMITLCLINPSLPLLQRYHQPFPKANKQWNTEASKHGKDTPYQRFKPQAPTYPTKTKTKLGWEEEDQTNKGSLLELFNFTCITYPWQNKFSACSVLFNVNSLHQRLEIASFVTDFQGQLKEAWEWKEIINFFSLYEEKENSSLSDQTHIYL